MAGVGRLCGAWINIPAYYKPDAYHVILVGGMTFDAIVAWDKDEWPNGAVGPAEGDPALNNDEAMISAATGATITVVRNKDGIYQSRTGVVMAVSKRGYNDEQARGLLTLLTSRPG